MRPSPFASKLKFAMQQLISERLYFNDSYLKQFKARVLEMLDVAGKPAVVLDRSCFYPTSGGQPFDTGRLNNARVIDVQVRAEDGVVLHILDQELWEQEVNGQISWSRRFDHMQQHTGQHILSQAFIQVAEAQTVGFHLSDDNCTIDVDRQDLTPAQISQTEQLANDVVWRNEPVRAYVVTREQAQKLRLRKIPAVDGNRLRLIEIGKFDLTACGGTHVANTGEVGLIKIIRVERRRDALRVTFRCGQRALNDYREKNTVVNALTSELTVGYWDLETSVVKLRDEAKNQGRLARKLQGQVVEMEMERLIQAAKPYKGVYILDKVFVDMNPGDLRKMAATLVKEGKYLLLFGLAGDKSQLLFARSPEVAGEMNQLIKPALQVLGSASGGGNAELAQGGGPAATVEQVEQALKRARQLAQAQIR